MFQTPILDVAIGLVFVYLTVSLMCTAVQELIASVAALRSKTLAKGIKNLLANTNISKLLEDQDPQGTSEQTKSLADAVYAHPLIKAKLFGKVVPIVGDRVAGVDVVEVQIVGQGRVVYQLPGQAAQPLRVSEQGIGGIALHDLWAQSPEQGSTGPRIVDNSNLQVALPVRRRAVHRRRIAMGARQDVRDRTARHRRHHPAIRVARPDVRLVGQSQRPLRDE